MAWLPVTATRAERATQVITQVRAEGLPDRACVIALMMTCAESGVQNLASEKVPASLAYPHDGVAPGDHESVGIAQAQWPWWGGVAECMNVPMAIHHFIVGLPGVPGLLNTNWQTGDLGWNVQQVQRSAFSDGSNYAVYESFAYYLLDRFGDAAAGVLPTIPAKPQPTWADKLPVIEVGALNDLIHQPDGVKHNSVQLVYRALAAKGCGKRLSRMVRTGVINSADHPYAVAAVRKFQKQRFDTVTGVLTLQELEALGNAKATFHSWKA